MLHASSFNSTPTKFSDPVEVVKHMHLQEGMRVADFGSGSGHYARAAAAAVGDLGAVYAIDIQQGLLKSVHKSGKEARKNIHVIWGDVEAPGGSKLGDSSTDAVIMANVLFQIDRRAAAISEAHRVLKPGGRVLVVDWKDSFGGLGPLPQDVVGEEKARELFERGGFAFERTFAAGAHHWGLAFRKS